MAEKSKERWQHGAAVAGVLEPGEQVRAAATGTKAGSIWVLLLSPFDAFEGPLAMIGDAVTGAVYGALELGRVYLVTDRNVYVGRLSSWNVHMAQNTIVEHVDEVLDKRPLDEAVVTYKTGFMRRRLRLNDGNPMAVGMFGPGKRWAKEVVAAVEAR